MEQLRNILIRHAAAYPKMEPADAVKLIYQNEFGGGHMIADAESCMAFLRREWDSVAPDGAVPLAEDIGNGLFRIWLAAAKFHRRDPDDIGRAFILGANSHRGSRTRFLEKLEVLKALSREGELPFSSAALEEYLAPYLAAGCPAVSHSRSFRDAYRPAYRVIPGKLLEQAGVHAL